MFEKLNMTYGISLKVSREKQITGVPIYMLAGRKQYEVQYGELTFLAVCVQSSGRFGSIALEKQLALYQNSVSMPVAYVFDKLTSAQRSSLVRKHIPFIAEPDQIYLPFMGVMLRNSLNNKAMVSAEKMMPATQCVFLYLIYRGHEGCLKKNVAEKLGITRTSVSRASEQLTAMGLIREERSGREIRMYPVSSGPEIFELAKQHLIDPVQRTVYAKLDSVSGCSVLSGESALAARTMLNDPDIPVFAVSGKSEIARTLQVTDLKWETDAEVCKIEIWKYAPELFASGQCADPISLAMSQEGQKDERMEEALAEYMEKYQW